MPVVHGTPEEELVLCQEYRDRLEAELADVEVIMRGLKDGPLPIKESEFEGQVRQLARLYGWLCYHTWRSINSPPGFPDLVLVKGPRLVFAELKTATGKLSQAQQEWLDALRETPAEVYLWRPGDWEEIVACLSKQ